MKRLLRSIALPMFVGVMIQSCTAQNELSKYLYSRDWTPVGDHSSQFVPGAIIEVALHGGDWTVWPASADQKVLLLDHFTGGLDQSANDTFLDAQGGIAGLASLFGGGVSAGFEKDSVITFSGMTFDAYTLSSGQEKRLLGDHTGSVYNKVIDENDDSRVGYFLITTVASASHAEVKSSKVVAGHFSLGAKDNGNCTLAQSPASTGTPRTVEEMKDAVDRSAQQSGAATGQNAGVDVCHKGTDYVVFDSKAVEPVAIKVKLLTIWDSGLVDTDYGEPPLPLWDKAALARKTKDLIAHAYK